MDMNSENWEQLPPLPDMEAELKKIRRDLRRRNIKIVLISLVLVAAMLFGIVQYGIPALEKQYWDPNTSTYMEGIPDLQITMDVYSELFCPGYSVLLFDSVKTGFATHTLNVAFRKYVDANHIGYDSEKNAILSKNELIFPSNFWAWDIADPFNIGGGLYTLKTETDSALTALKKYADYIMVQAAVTFPEDLTTSEIIAFDSEVENYISKRADNATVTWFAIRTGEDKQMQYPACGMQLAMYRYDGKAIADSEYPSLFHGLKSYTAESVEQHFNSLLQFSQDQLDNGTGFLPPRCTNENYYTDVMTYVEENGLKSYGAYIIATPSVLLELYDDGLIDGIEICDAWIRY